MKAKPTLGRVEIEFLRYVADYAPVTVRQAADDFAASRGIVRTTVLNMMERLRVKGYLTRRKVEGIYHYQPKASKAELLRQLVGTFVQQALGGSISPFVAYLTQDADLNEEELAELKALVKDLDTRKK